MRKHEPERLKGQWCPGCGKSSTFILIDGHYVCAGDEKKRRIGCGKKMEKDR